MIPPTLPSIHDYTETYGHHPPYLAATDTSPMAEFLMVVGNISPLWMYTTAKLAARHSLPSRADDARTAGKLPEK